jgi:hypothetical protein
MVDYAMQILTTGTVTCKTLLIRRLTVEFQTMHTANSALHMLLKSDEATGCCIPGIEQVHIYVSV